MKNIKQGVSLAKFLRIVKKENRHLSIPIHFSLCDKNVMAWFKYNLTERKKKYQYDHVDFVFSTYKPSFSEVEFKDKVTKVLKDNNGNYYLTVKGWEYGILLLEYLSDMKEVSFVYEQPNVYCFPTH